MVVGRTASEEKTMGHAGAVVGEGPSAAEKARALEKAGAVIAVHPGELGEILKGLLKDKEIDLKS